MKAHELSVGDYVEYRGKPCKIIEVSLYSVLLSGVPAQRSIEHIFPVPLTIEILENNGFAAKNYYADSLGVDNLFVDDYAKCGVWADQKDGYDFDTIVECNFDESAGFTFNTSIRGIKYVHELQHALKLCRIEKEIKL